MEMSPSSHVTAQRVLTSLQRRVDVEGRLLYPGHNTDQFLDETRYNTPEYCRAPARSPQHFNLDFVRLRHHCKQTERKQDVRIYRQVTSYASLLCNSEEEMHPNGARLTDKTFKFKFSHLKRQPRERERERWEG
jgi:hypothetical protein